MIDDPLTLVWRHESEKNDYWYGTTRTRFSAQIGKSVNAGLYMWMIFHEDILYVVYAEEVASVEESRQQSQAWLRSNAKPPQHEPGERAG